jgi:glycosyltransferase involved in cell wall biosynthesis
MASPVVLSPYPLSLEDRVCFDEMLGATPAFLSVGELRRLPVSQMIGRLRSSGAELCVIAIPDQPSAALRPLLHTLAAVTRFRRVDVVGPDHRRVRLTRRTVPRSAAAVLAASLDNLRTLHVARFELAALRAGERTELAMGNGPEVLYVNANLSLGLRVGGSVGHMAGVANALAAAGHQVHLASLAVPSLLNGGVRVVPLLPPATLAPPFEDNSYRFSRVVVSQLRPRLTRHWTRFIYQRLTVANYSGVVLSRQAGVPLVLEYNGSEAWSAMHWGTPLRHHRLAVAAEDASLKHAHVVVTVSRVLRDELEERGVAPERIVCYPNCVDPALFDPDRVSKSEMSRLRADLGIPDDAIVVAFVGTFGRWHGVDVLASTIRRFATAEDHWLAQRRVRFLLVGDGLLAGEVDAVLASDLRCAQFVIRTGAIPQQDVPTVLASADIVVSPHVPNPDGSRFFGSPTKLFEYMAAERAILASDLEQIGEVLQPSLQARQPPEGEPGPQAPELAVLSEPGNVDDLICGLRFLVEHPGWRRALGANARSRALQRYTWSDHVAAILERLLEVVPSSAKLASV